MKELAHNEPLLGSERREGPGSPPRRQTPYVTRERIGTRTIFGVSLLWLGLAMIFDGINALVLPTQLAGFGGQTRASLLGIVTFVGIGLGLVVQPIVGSWSDSAVTKRGRLRLLSLAGGATVALLVVLGRTAHPVLIVLTFVSLMVAANALQAVLQPLLPERIGVSHRGRASGLKSFFDLAGAATGFVFLGGLLETGGASSATMGIAVVVAATLVGTRLLLPERPAERMVKRASMRDSFKIDTQLHRDFVDVVLARFLFLLGTFAVGRFLLYLVADRLDIAVGDAGEEAGYILGGLALVTALAALVAGWLTDRVGRIPMMSAGVVLSTLGILMLIWAPDPLSIFVFGSLMALGSASFGVGNWALAADLAPHSEPGRFLGLANIGTAGAAAVAGLLGLLVDVGDALDAGFTPLLVVAAGISLASVLPLRRLRRRQRNHRDQTYLEAMASEGAI